MLLFGEEAGGNPRTLSLIHATRVLVIVAAVPHLLRGIWQADLGNPPGALSTSIPTEEQSIMVACALFGWWAAARIGLFGASILGPLIVTAVSTLSDFLHHHP